MAKVIQFQAGTGRHLDGAVNYLASVDGSVYAECRVPEGASEDYGYLTLKHALEQVLINLGERDGYTFWYDWQEEFLSDDADAQSPVYITMS